MENTRFNSNIKILRKRKGFSQEDLGNKVGLSRSLVGAWEDGRAEPSLAVAIKLSRIFNITLDDLISKDIKKGHSELLDTKKVMEAIEEFKRVKARTDDIVREYIGSEINIKI